MKHSAKMGWNCHEKNKKQSSLMHQRPMFQIIGCSAQII